MAVSTAFARWRASATVRGAAVLVLGLVLLLALGRLLYLPSSRTLADEESSAMVAPRNTSLVLEGIARRTEAAELDGETLPDGPAVTLAFESFRSLTLRSPGAAVSGGSRAVLEEMGARLPTDAAPRSMDWNVNLPREEGASAPLGFIRVEIVPAEGGDLSIGMRDDALRLTSPTTFELMPVAEGYRAIGGRLRLDDKPIGAPSDIMPELLILPAAAAGAEATARLSYQADDPTAVLGDPFAGEGALAISAVAHRDEFGNLITRYCGAPEDGGILWSAFFQPNMEPQPEVSGCEPGWLRISSIDIGTAPNGPGDGAVRVVLGGSAYVPGLLSVLASLQGNMVLWPVVLLLIGIPLVIVRKGVTMLLAEKKQAAAAA